ncbi:hypothetical protein [Micromonospora chalcea]|uniref:hypothetical protein n=1 Tax=Micromonospora chalcea TaxID=1874 RepID=UPI003D71EB7C
MSEKNAVTMEVVDVVADNMDEMRALLLPMLTAMKPMLLLLKEQGGEAAAVKAALKGLTELDDMQTVLVGAYAVLLMEWLNSGQS